MTDLSLGVTPLERGVAAERGVMLDLGVSPATERGVMPVDPDVMSAVPSSETYFATEGCEAEGGVRQL